MPSTRSHPAPSIYPGHDGGGGKIEATGSDQYDMHCCMASSRKEFDRGDVAIAHAPPFNEHEMNIGLPEAEILNIILYGRI